MVAATLSFAQPCRSSLATCATEWDDLLDLFHVLSISFAKRSVPLLEIKKSNKA